MAHNLGIRNIDEHSAYILNISDTPQAAKLKADDSMLFWADIITDMKEFSFSAEAAEFLHEAHDAVY